MQLSRKLLLLSVVALSSILSSELAVEARGGVGGSYHVVKEVRQPGLWYGDAFVSDDDKRAIYSNYQGRSAQGANTAGQNYNANTQPAYNGNRNQITPLPNYAQNYAQSTQSSAPAYIGPSSYKYFVQEYDWKH